METSVRDWVAKGTWDPGVRAMVTVEAASRGFTLEARPESVTEAGDEAGVSIMVTSEDTQEVGDWSLETLGCFTLKDWMIIHCVVFTFCRYHTRKRNAVRITFTASHAAACRS